MKKVLRNILDTLFPKRVINRRRRFAKVVLSFMQECMKDNKRILNNDRIVSESAKRSE